jgi:hypothetical protein
MFIILGVDMELNRSLLINVLLALVVIALLVFIWHYYIDWKYKAEFLMKPCDLCQSLNPEVRECLVKKVQTNQLDDSLMKINFSSIQDLR